MRHRTLLVWTLGLVAGIAAQTAEYKLLMVWLALGVAGLGLLVISGRRWAWATVGIALAGLGAGAVRLAAFQTVPETDISRYARQDAPVMLTGSVVSDPELRRGGRVTLFLRAQQVEQYGIAHAVTGNVSVALTADALANTGPLDYGDLVALGGRLDIPPNATNPGAFSWRDYLARRGVWCELRVKRPGAVQHLGGSALNPFLRLAWHIRKTILTSVHAGLPPLPAAVLSGVLLGQRTELPPDLMADFVHTGTVHILASAGLHVGIIAWWALWLCERLTLPRKASASLIIGTLWLYALMAGGRPSVTRAVVFATLYFGAILFEREPDAPTTFAAAALVILLFQPTALLETGFQLSFLTVLTLVLGMPLWQHLWRSRIEALTVRPRPRKFLTAAADLIGLTLFAQLGSWPIVALDYDEVSLSGFGANSLVVPALFVLIPLGLLGAAWGTVFPCWAQMFMHPAGMCLTYITAVIQWFSQGAGSFWAIVAPPPLTVVCYYMLVFGVLIYSRRLCTSAQRSASKRTCQANARPFLS